MPKKTESIVLNHFLFWALTTLLLIRGLIFGALVGLGAVDPTFFTYQNYMLDILWLLLLIISAFRRWSFQIWALFIFPIYWGTTTFVAIAISIIVKLNDKVYTVNSVLNNGTRTFGDLYLGDNLVHQYPMAEVLLVFVLMHYPIVQTFHHFYSTLSTPEKVKYTLYFLLSSWFVLLCYMLNFDFLGNYPTSISEPGTVALVIVLAVLSQTVLFLLMYFSSLYYPDYFSGPSMAPMKRVSQLVKERIQ